MLEKRAEGAGGRAKETTGQARWKKGKDMKAIG